jgi:probable DNA metabolism protein
MNVFCYDKSFEGLLTAVFDAYFRRCFPDALAGEGEPLPMFAEEVHHVATDGDKAARVWGGLMKKVPAYVRNMLMYAWLSEQEGSDYLIMRYIVKVFASPNDMTTNFGDDDVLQLKKLADSVAKEGERMRQFIRFQKASDGTYFAPVAPQFNSLPLALDYLRDRFADQRWLVYDTKRRYGYAYDLNKVTEVTMDRDDDLIEGKLSDEIMAADEKQFQAMWRTYHKALAIKERINPRLQRQHIPRKYWKYMTEMQHY